MYDYVIVGAGSAGCVLANRLTEDPDVSVCLVEAGPPDTEEGLHIPVAFSQLYKTPFDWDFATEPEPALDGRSVYLPARPRARRLVVAQRDDLHPRPPRATTTSGATSATRAGAGTTCCPTSSAPRTTSAARPTSTAPAARCRCRDSHSMHPLADAFVEAAAAAGHRHATTTSTPASRTASGATR